MKLELKLKMKLEMKMKLKMKLKLKLGWMLKFKVLFASFVLAYWGPAWGVVKTPRVIVGIPTQVTSLDPFQLTGIDTYQATGNVLEPLVRVNPKTKELIPCLAKSWSVDQKKRVIRVKLRAGVEFQNGEKLTAEDVRFTFEAFANPQYKGAIWAAMWEGIASVQVVDPLTVEFQMKDLKYLTFENVMTNLRILPKSFYSPYDSEKFRTQICGTGPFRLLRFHPGQSIEFKPNDEYWGESTLKALLTIKTVAETRLAEQMMEKGDLDEYPIFSSVDGTKLDEKFLYRSKATLGEGLWIDLNLRRELFTDLRVRQALLLLWNRSHLSEKLFDNKLELALDTFSPKVPYYPKGKPLPYDLKKARALLKAAGWADSNQDAVLDRQVSGHRQDFRFQILIQGTESERWVSLYQSEALKLGIRVDIQRIEGDSQFWKALKDGKFDAVAGTGGVSESPHASTWRSGGFYNFSGYHNAKVDQNIDLLEKEFDLKIRHQLETKIIAQIRADVPQIPGLYSPNQYLLVSPRVQVDDAFPLLIWHWRLKD